MFTACGILVPWPDQELNPCCLKWKYGALTTELPGSPPRNYFLCSLTGSNSSTMKVLLDCSNLIISSGSISNSSYLAISTTSAFISSTEVLNPSKSSMRIEINFFQTHVNVYILPSSHKLWMFLMASRILSPFQKIFSWLHPEEWLSMVAIALWNVFLK